MKPKSLFTLLILPVVWGAYYVATNIAVAKMSVFTVGIMIRFGAMILLSALILFRGEWKLLFKVRHVWPRLLLIGLLGFLLDATAFLGLTLCPAGIGTVLLKTDIIFVTLISVIFYHQRLSAVDWVYMFVMLGGIVLVMGIDFSNVNLGGAGNLFFILSALFVSINAFVIKGVQHDKKNPICDSVVAFYNNFITMILFIGATAIRGEFSQLAVPASDGTVLAALIAAALGQTLVYVIYYHNLRHYPVWLVKVFLLLMPVVTAIISYFLLNEKLVLTQIIGMAVVLLCAGGIVLRQKDGGKGRTERDLSDE